MSSLLRALLLVACPVVGLAQAFAEPGSAVITFNEEQALRGQTLYYAQCLSCHGETMAGVDKAPPLTGPQFTSNWNGAPLAAVQARILTMPPEKPGTLNRQQAADILSYILWYNGLPLGDAELSAEPGVLAQLILQLP